MSKKTNKNEKPQNKRLDNRRRKELKKILSERYLINVNKNLVNFISLYIDCEATAKKFVQYYKSDKGQKNSEAYEVLKYDEVEKAAKYFGLNIDSQLIVSIFSSGRGIRGSKTSRQLRNGILHSKAVKDIEEVEQRFDELIKLMGTWIDKSKEVIHRL